MKDLIIALVIMTALIVYFSFADPPTTELTTRNGFGTQYKGDSGQIIPGDGDLLADTLIEQESIPECSEQRQTSSEPTVPETTREIHTEIISKEKIKMDGMLIAFWHGVVAVLIGEASALMVAFVWRRWQNGQTHNS